MLRIGCQDGFLDGALFGVDAGVGGHSGEQADGRGVEAGEDVADEAVGVFVVGGEVFPEMPHNIVQVAVDHRLELALALFVEPDVLDQALELVVDARLLFGRFVHDLVDAADLLEVGLIDPGIVRPQFCLFSKHF